MSRTAANFNMTWTRGATVEEEFVYTDEAGVPVNLTGYEARMQVRSLDGRFGTTTTTTLMVEFATTGVTPVMSWATAANGRLTLVIPPSAHAALNPDNEKKAVYAYSIEVYQASPEYVIPLVEGKLVVLGETTR